MIVFDLKCANSHTFEVWFRSSSDYESQKSAGYLSCPYCNDTNITKAIMAPNVAAKSNQKSDVPHKADPITESKSPSVPVAGDVAPKSKAESGAKPENATTETMMDVIKDNPEITEALHQAMETVRDHVEKNFDNVGGEFAEEARKIHYGESKERPIYGDATREETEELLDEGIEVLPLPALRKVDG